MSAARMVVVNFVRKLFGNDRRDNNNDNESIPEDDCSTTELAEHGLRISSSAIGVEHCTADDNLNSKHLDRFHHSGGGYLNEFVEDDSGGGCDAATVKYGSKRLPLQTITRGESVLSTVAEDTSTASTARLKHSPHSDRYDNKTEYSGCSSDPPPEYYTDEATRPRPPGEIPTAEPVCSCQKCRRYPHHNNNLSIYVQLLPPGASAVNQRRPIPSAEPLLPLAYERRQRSLAMDTSHCPPSYVDVVVGSLPKARSSPKTPHARGGLVADDIVQTVSLVKDSTKTGSGQRETSAVRRKSSVTSSRQGGGIPSVGILYYYKYNA